MREEPINLEGAPTDDQKIRLDDFMIELGIISRRYNVLVEDVDETVQLRDLDSGNVIAMGIGFLTDPQCDDLIRGYVPVDSILDGVWPVDTPDGPVDQRHVMNVNPLRDPPA